MDKKPVSSGTGWTLSVCDAVYNKLRLFFWLAASMQLIHGAYKLSEDFAKPYFYKY